MANGDDTPRVVITGLGVVSPIGTGRDVFWESLQAGRSGIRRRESVGETGSGGVSDWLAEITDFDPLEYLPSRKLLKVMSRDIQLGVAASRLAVDDAGIERGDMPAERIGVSFGAGRISSLPEDLLPAALGVPVPAGAGDASDFDGTRWGEDGLGRITPVWLLKRLPNMPACHVSIGLDARGPNNTITSRGTSGLLALAEGVRVIERGAADCMVVGGCGSMVHAVDLVKLRLYGQIGDGCPESAWEACRPFDASRTGAVPGEGAASLVIERHESAARRGATILAEVLGCGAGCDGPGDDGRGAGLEHAIGAALADAGVSASDLAHLTSGATGSPSEDAVEAAAIARALGSSTGMIPVTSLAGYVGHADAGSGAMELAGCLLSLRHKMVPFTWGFESPSPDCSLNVVAGSPRLAPGNVAVACHRSEFGQSAAVVLGVA